MFRSKEFTGVITDVWTTVPWCTTDFGNYGNTATDHLAAIHDPTIGIGDICRYMGIVDGSTWRIPTQSEWAELYNTGEHIAPPGSGGWVIGSFHPISGQVMGPGRYSVAIAGNGADVRVVNADPNTDGAVFFSASGHRNGSSTIQNIGAENLCWTSTAESVNNAYRIAFYSTTVIIQQSNNRTNAFSVRCIRE